MEAQKEGSLPGRAKGRYERLVPIGLQQAACLKALIRRVAKTPVGELRDETLHEPGVLSVPVHNVKILAI
jgi:hypothetical protein